MLILRGRPRRADSAAVDTKGRDNFHCDAPELGHRGACERTGTTHDIARAGAGEKQAKTPVQLSLNGLRSRFL